MGASMSGNFSSAAAGMAGFGGQIAQKAIEKARNSAKEKSKDQGAQKARTERAEGGKNERSKFS
jgi:hypothetical protein